MDQKWIPTPVTDQIIRHSNLNPTRLFFKIPNTLKQLTGCLKGPPHKQPCRPLWGGLEGPHGRPQAREIWHKRAVTGKPPRLLREPTSVAWNRPSTSLWWVNDQFRPSQYRAIRQWPEYRQSTCCGRAQKSPTGCKNNYYGLALAREWQNRR